MPESKLPISDEALNHIMKTVNDAMFSDRGCVIPPEWHEEQKAVFRQLEAGTLHPEEHYKLAMLTEIKLCGRCSTFLRNGAVFGKAGKVPLCHPDDPALADCYHLVTVAGEPLANGRRWTGSGWKA